MISKVLNLIKTNLLVITVTFGVCAFLFEGLIKYNPSFNLTKYAFVLIVSASIYNKFGDKWKEEMPLTKSKYDLNLGVFLGYLKYRLSNAPIQIFIFSTLYFLFTNKTYANTYGWLLIIGFIENFFSYAKEQRYLGELAEKGLTPSEVDNRAFIKHWEENRERGMLKYCIINGGIIAGALLSLFVSLIWLFVLSANNKPAFAVGPGEIFQFIGISYLIGAFTGSISYRIIWSLKQERFKRLATNVH